MDSTNQNSKVPSMLCDVDQQQYMFFSHSIAASFSKRKTHFDNFGCMKRMAICEPAEGRRRAKRTKSKVLKAPSENNPLTEHSTYLEEDSDLKSDAESSCCPGLDAIETAANDESINELFYHGGARKKLELLADMVGVDTKEPGFVLAKVVAVLKNLKSKSGRWY